MRQTIKIRICETDTWNDNLWQAIYEDEEYEVYSYKLEDGMYCFTFDDIEEALKEKGLTEEQIKKAINDLEAEEEAYAEISWEEIIKMGYSIVNKKTGKIIKISMKDMEHCCYEGCITLPNGEQCEPDADNSPLKQMGMI